jgi:hypothetical protein
MRQKQTIAISVSMWGYLPTSIMHFTESLLIVTMAINSFFSSFSSFSVRCLLLFIPRPLTYHASYDVILRGGSERITIMSHYQGQLVMRSVIMQGSGFVTCHCRPRKITQIRDPLQLAIHIESPYIPRSQNCVRKPVWRRVRIPPL